MPPQSQRPTPASDSNPKEPRENKPTLFYAILAIILIGIVAFMVLRPGGTGSGESSPAAPKTTQH